MKIVIQMDERHKCRTKNTDFKIKHEKMFKTLDQAKIS
jgi:hypothetical protein